MIATNLPEEKDGQSISVILWWRKWDIHLCHPQEQEQLQLPSNSPGIQYVGSFGGKMRESEIRGFDGKIKNNIAILLKVHRAIQIRANTVLGGCKHIWHSPWRKNLVNQDYLYHSYSWENDWVQTTQGIYEWQKKNKNYTETVRAAGAISWD